VRYGSFLQRRLVKLESKLKVPGQCEFDNRVVAKALSNLSIEDLRLLREGAVRRAAGAVFQVSREYNEVLQPANMLLCPSAGSTPYFDGHSRVTGRRSIGRRLEKLEAVANVLSTADKWAMIDHRARQLVSDQITSPEDAFWMAMSETTVPFTIPEMDQLLTPSGQC